MKKLGEINGIELFYIKADKFKTGSINITFIDNLSPDRAYKNALIPAILTRGSKNYPSQRQISRRLMELYGAGFTTGVEKRGELQVIQFIADFVEEKYIDTGSNILSDLLDLMFDIICKPLEEGGGFLKEYFDQERDNHNDNIRSLINDKQAYALFRCNEEMCKDEPYRISELGRVEDGDLLDNEEVYNYYFNYFLKRLPIKIFISSMEEPKVLVEKVHDLAKIFEGDKIKLSLGFLPKKIDKVNEVVDNMNVSQGKLTMGFRTNVSPRSHEVHALSFLNGILGASVHSKLFQIVREKHSLAYYALSRLDIYKGLLIAFSGIEFANKEKTQDLIIEQLEDIRNGIISEEEFESTRLMYRNIFNSYKDTQFGLMDFYIGQILVGQEIHDLDEMIDIFYNIKKEEIISLAKKIELDTVYFLNSKEEGNEQL